MNDLVARLSSGSHPVEIVIRPERTIPALKECLSRDFVHVRFVGTRGGTELGIRIDRSETDVSGVDFEKQHGTMKLVGRLTLDYIPVTCVAEIDVRTFAGEGHLRPST